MKPPTKATLRKYGLSLERWQGMYDRQGGQCAICRANHRPLQIDHHHARGWKKMKPERRVEWVRALTCWPCNRYLLGPVRYGMTSALYRRAADYLDAWALVRPKRKP